MPASGWQGELPMQDAGRWVTGSRCLYCVVENEVQVKGSVVFVMWHRGKPFVLQGGGALALSDTKICIVSFVHIRKVLRNK